MICERCQMELAYAEGRKIIYNDDELWVCAKCLEEIRRKNIKESEEEDKKQKIYRK